MSIIGTIGDAIFGQSKSDQYGKDVTNVDKNNFKLPGGDAMRKQRELAGNNAHNRTAGRAATHQAGQSGMRGNQQALGNMLMQRAQGQGPSVAETQARQTMNQGMKQQLAMAAGARPGQQGAAARQASQNASAMQGQVAGQAALGRAQEAMTAANSLGNVLGTARGQDQRLAMQNAQMRQAGGQFNVDAQARQRGMNDQYASEMYRQQLAAAQAQQQGGMGYENQMGNRYGMIMGDQSASGGDSLLGAASGLLALSDKREKKDISKAGDKMDSFLDAMSAYSYEYKDDKYGKGTQHGIMAQDLERSEVGKSFVKHTQDGKKFVDTSGVNQGTILAALARLNEKINEGK